MGESLFPRIVLSYREVTSCELLKELNVTAIFLISDSQPMFTFDFFMLWHLPMRAISPMSSLSEYSHTGNEYNYSDSEFTLCNMFQ